MSVLKFTKCFQFALGFALCALTSSPLAQAFVFSPMSVEFDPSGPGATRSFSVENDGDKPIAVEFAIYPRSQDLEGKEPAEAPGRVEKRFAVYPPQTLLQPKEKRTLRVTWVGESQLSKELPFRIVAEQLRLNTEKKNAERQGGAMIDLLLKYRGSLYVRPKEAKPELLLKTSELISGTRAKGPSIAVVFENKGNAHQLLAGVHLRVKVNTKEVLLKPNEIPEISSQNVLAGGSRRFVVPWPKGLPPGPLQVKLERAGD